MIKGDQYFSFNYQISSTFDFQTYKKWKTKVVLILFLIAVNKTFEKYLNFQTFLPINVINIGNI